MGITKSHFFNEEQNKLAEYAKAFAHPARIAITQYLLQNQTCIVGTLANELPLSQSTLSQHLKERKRIGIIKGEVEGPSICYCINKDVWTNVYKQMNALFEMLHVSTVDNDEIEKK